MKLVIKYIKEVYEKGVDLVFFFEMWLNGYVLFFEDVFNYLLVIDFDNERIKWLNEVIIEDSVYFLILKEFVKELKIGICVMYLFKME